MDNPCIRFARLCLFQPRSVLRDTEVNVGPELRILSPLCDPYRALSAVRYCTETLQARRVLRRSSEPKVWVHWPE
jgi:hypothetical protein